MERRFHNWSSMSFAECLMLGLTLSATALAGLQPALGRPIGESHRNFAFAPNAATTLAPVYQDGGRPMTVNDVLARQRINGVALSPDGKWVAVVVERPKKPGELYARGYMGGAERSDVWLVSTNGGPAINVTRGEREHAGYWEPIWSPDGKRLAMASTNGGDNVRCYVYDLVKRRLSRLTDSGMDLTLGIQLKENNPPAAMNWFAAKAPTMQWLDPTHVLLGILPHGARPEPFDDSERTPQIAASALATVKRGQGVTAKVLTSGETERVEPPSSEVALTVVDTETRTQRVITTIPLTEMRLAQRVVSISPSRHHAAIMATYPAPKFQPTRRLSTSDPRALRLGVIEFKERQTIRWFDNVRLVTFGLGGTTAPIRWAASGSAFASIGILDGPQNVETKAFTVNVGDGKAQRVEAVARVPKLESSDRVLMPENIQWFDDKLMVYGYSIARADLQSESIARSVRGFGPDNTIDSARRDWWMISSDGSSRNLTAQMAQTPRQLLPMRRAGAMLGNAGGRLWTIDITGTVSLLAVTSNVSTATILSPAQGEAPLMPVDNLIISSPSDTGTSVYFVNLNERKIGLLRAGAMPKNAIYRDGSYSSGVVAYVTPETGLSVLRGGREAPITLISLNRGMDSIAKPQYRPFEYQSMDGKMLRGALLLPHGYVSGKRYPLVVIVYGGSNAPSGDWANPYRTSAYQEPLLIAGRGYAVLIPSVPLQPMGVGSDPMLDLDKGIKPAIEKVVEMGIADANRLGVFGHSYGGYSVYGLVTQTERFRAAVAFAGVTDLTSYYGRLDPRYRFSSTINPLSSPATVESQQMRMGVPLWENPERYLRNSPFFHADRVTTPVLMIHGELDSIPSTQAEQFFVALNRLNKRSKLVRYLGEGHGIDSPQNVRDFWQQVFCWFDEFLNNARNEESHTDGKKPKMQVSPGNQ